MAVSLADFDYKKQTREVKNRTDGARISNLNKNDALVSCVFEDGKTLHELFLRGKRISKNGDFLGWKPSANEPFKWLTYSQVYDIALETGSAFIQCGLEPRKENFIGIFAKNRPEWVFTEKACNAYSFISVPLYDTFGDEAINYILNQTNIKLVVCDDSQKALQLMKSKSSLTHIVIIDDINEAVVLKGQQTNISIYSFEEIRQIGRNNYKEPLPPKPDYISTICYTSGTTGMPKGAIITHGNMVSIESSIYVYLKGILDTQSEKLGEEQHRYISYLPLAHMFERNAQAFVQSIGGKIGFFQGDIKKLSDDIKELKPTIFCTVPRLLNRIYSAITEKIEASSCLKKRIFKICYTGKEKELLKGKLKKKSIYNFAFKKIRENLGGCVQFLLTGSAPISPDVLQFIKVCTGCYVIEGYGATETGGASGSQIPGESTVGNVGPPFLCCMYKLADVPDMGLIAKRDNRGEICIYGTNIFKGYYKDEEKTKEALDSEGWYHTGDIGSWEPNGTLKIVDRVKNIFKLQQGEYVAPEKIENIYVRSKYVAQIFVYGNSYKSSIVGIVVPEETVLLEWATNNNINNANMKQLCSNSEVKKLIMNDLEQQAKLGGLKGFEKVKDIYLHDDLFSIENGLLTPTMKSKRNELQKKFQAQLDDMNSRLD